MDKSRESNPNLGENLISEVRLVRAFIKNITIRITLWQWRDLKKLLILMVYSLRLLP